MSQTQLRFSDFKAAEAELQEAFKPIAKEGYIVRVEPVDGLDLFYSDGTAANYTAKIAVQVNSFGLTHSWYFTPAGPVHLFPRDYDTVFRAWIASVVAKVR